MKDELRELVRDTASAAIERTHTLDGHIRLNIGCALAQAVTWCPVCGVCHMQAANCASPDSTAPIPAVDATSRKVAGRSVRGDAPATPDSPSASAGEGSAGGA